MIDLKSTFDQISKKVMIVSNDHIVEYINKDFLKHFIHSPENPTGKKLHEIFGTNAFQSQLKPNIERCLSGEKEDFILQNTNFRKDICFEIHPITQNDKKYNSVLFIEKDSFDDKITNEMISINENNWINIINSIDDGVFIVDDSFTIEDINTKALNIFDKKRNEVIGKKCYEIIHNTDKPYDDCPLIQCKTDKKAHNLETYEESQKKWISFKCSPVINEDGKIVKYVDIMRDVTNSKEREEQLQLRNDEISVLNDQYYASIQELKESNEYISQLLEVLKQGEEHFKLISENSIDIISRISADGKFLYVSPSCENILGYTQAELFNSSFLEYLYEDDKENHQRAFNEMVNGKKSNKIISRFNTKDGKTKWLEINGSLILNKNQDVVEIISVARDITERILIEQNNEIIERRYKTIAEEFPNGAIFLFGRDLKYKMVAGTGLDKVGLNKKDLIGKTVYESFPESVSRIAGPNTKELFKGIPCYYEITFAGNYYANWGAPIRDDSGYITEAIVYALDITDLKETEDRLRNSLNSMQQGEEIAELGFFERNWKTMDGYWSVGFYKLLGLNPDETDCTKIDFLDHVHQNDINKVKDHISETLAKRKKMDIEFRLIKKNGEMIYVQAIGIHYYDDEGNPEITNGTFRDITIEKETKRKVNEAYQIINNSNIVVFTWKNEKGWPVEFVSKNVEKLSGYEENEFTENNISYENLIHPEDLERVKDTVLKNSVDRNISEFYHKPYRIYTREKQIKWVKDWTSIVRNDEGIITHYKGVVEDITEQVLSRQELKKAKEDLDEIITASSVGLCLLRNRKLVWANDTMEELFGYSKEEYKGRDTRFIYPDDEEYNRIGRIVYENISQGKQVSTEASFLHKNGKLFTGMMKVNLLDMKNPIKGALVSIIDISDRKEMENEIRDREILLNLALEGSRTAVWELDLRTNRINIYNEKYWEALLGYTKADFDSIDLDLWQELIHPHDKEAIIKELNDTIEGRNKSFNVEYRMLHKNGSWIWVNARAKLSSYDDNGNPIKMNGIHIDINEQKKSEEKIKKRNEEYQILNEEYLSQNEELIRTMHELRKVNEDLDEAKARAEESDRLKSAFLANMSHEIRTPMNAIVGFAKMMTDEDTNQDEMKEYITIINNSANQLLALINDVIDISKIESGIIDVKKEHFNLDKLLMNITGEFQAQAENLNLIINCIIENDIDDFYYYSDKVKIKQIFTNLLSNSLKFTHEGNIEFGYKNEGNNILLFVRDTGIGIDKKYHKVIFERFRQIEDYEHKKFRGTGLGLSICKSLVDKLGGDIWVESEPGIGSSFYIELPIEKVEDKNEEIHQDTQDQEKYDLKGVKLLIAEDEETNYLLLRKILEKANAHHIWVVNGKDAIEVLEQQSDIDCIIMDIKMPIMDGYTATQKIKRKYPGIPIIAQTAYALSDDKQRAMKAGFDDYLSKPINDQTLIKSIRSLLDK